VVRVVISDGIGLVELSWLQRRLLGRPYIAFELARIVAVYEEKTPKRRTLGKEGAQMCSFVQNWGISKRSEAFTLGWRLWLKTSPDIAVEPSF